MTQRIANPCTPVRFRVWPPNSIKVLFQVLFQAKYFKKDAQRGCETTIPTYLAFFAFPLLANQEKLCKRVASNYSYEKENKIVHLDVIRKTCSPVAQLVEQTAVNRSVAGSSPAWGATSLVVQP